MDNYELAAVCAVANGPAPEHWLDLDHLPGRGIAWQRVSREGRHVVLEPVAGRAGDVRHGDVRRRRLAAAGSGHRHLTAYWSGHDAMTGDERPDPAEQALIAHLTALDLRTWALGHMPRGGSLTPGAVPPPRRVRILDLDSGAISDHPVLPVPPCAP
ncbi:hypothetical protein GCM10012275_31750 [Longimycelium tulufanense]|uniref:Uncharacterized protein n=1 Tax=Longimycelium tulufanense TaxID=907463 RepID=A0A8J3CFC2_9PSEU|nr:hypothetical protein GCM10012275_31750 [Longimycelium tulufanense]